MDPERRNRIAYDVLSLWLLSAVAGLFPFVCFAVIEGMGSRSPVPGLIVAIAVYAMELALLAVWLETQRK